MARLLVKNMGIQRVRASWNHKYVKQFFFTLPEQPEPQYILDEDIQLPINFAPFRVTNVLGEGMAGVDIQVSHVGHQDAASLPVHLSAQAGRQTDPELLAHPLGNGYYEAQELQDGVYTMTIHKDGYQDVAGKFSVTGGERLAEQTFSLPHYVTVQGTIVNSKGLGVQEASITLSGLNSQFVHPDTTIKTDKHGNFLLELLVTGAGSEDLSAQAGLQEHLDVTWTDTASAEFLPQPVTFSISHTFLLPKTPRVMNLGFTHASSEFLAGVSPGS